MVQLVCHNMKDTHCFFTYNDRKTIASFPKLMSQPDKVDRMKLLKKFVDIVNVKSTYHNLGYKLTIQEGRVPKIKIAPTQPTMTIPGLVRTLCHDFE